ncbi:MAG: hypothetical protein ACLR5S_12640 [Ruminococcus sp.]
MSHTDYISEAPGLPSLYRELPGGCHGKSGKSCAVQFHPGKPRSMVDHAGQLLKTSAAAPVTGL